MNKVIFTIAFMAFSLSVFAQEFQGKAEYFSKRVFKTKGENKEAKSEQDIQFSKAVEEAMKKAGEKKYLLTFSKTESIYEQLEELEQPQSPVSGFSVSVVFSGEGKKYMNLKDKFVIEEADVFGKEFLIKEKLIPTNWTLVDETKNIGAYTCYKAIVEIAVTEKEKQEYEEFLKRDAIKPALFKMKEPKPKRITSWYTPEIPISFGPNNYYGLPGLILEINDEEKIILCSKVTLNNKVKAKIKAPNNGKTVTQKEFDKIEKDKTDSMRDEDGIIMFTRED